MEQKVKSPPGRGARSRASRDDRTGRLMILVAEDDDLIREGVSRYLTRQGYCVHTVSNGKDALATLAKETVHLLLLDLRLPGLDGFAVLRRVQERRRDGLPYVIVMSASPRSSDRRRAIELGGTDYLPKPFRLSQLRERIAAVEDSLRCGRRLEPASNR